MRDPDDFDAFYKAARERVLLQTYALTGDLAASRSAVRDAFVAAWHHWRKVSRLDDPEDWVRPHAWHAAQRRHTARLGRRDKALSSGEQATFDALAELTAQRRRALLLAELGTASEERMAREVGLPDELFGRELALARATFPIHRGIDPSQTAEVLHALAARTEEVRFPRPTIIRRAGAARRRAHTGLGVTVAVAGLLVATAVVGRPDGVQPGLEGIRATGPQSSAAPVIPPLDVDTLLTAGQVGKALGRRVGEPRTDDNTAGDGRHTICQAAPFADPEGVAALVRRMRVSGRGGQTVRQAVDLSHSTSDAEQAYDTAVGWYAGCPSVRARPARVQLLATYDVAGVGDEATLLLLRRWQTPLTTYAIGVARTGSLVTQVVHESPGAPRLRLQAPLTLLGDAIDGLCRHDDAGSCTRRARAVAAPPPAAVEAPGFLQVVDLPPVGRVRQPWSASSVLEADPNPARTLCDEATFTGRTIAWAGSRSILINGARLPASFGLSETIGRFRSVKDARTQLRTLHRRLSRCEDDDLSATVRELRDVTTRQGEIHSWHVRVEVSDNRTVDFHVALIRRGRDLAQVTFVPAGEAQMAPGGFAALSRRALERLVNLRTE